MVRIPPERGSRLPARTAPRRRVGQPVPRHRRRRWPPRTSGSRTSSKPPAPLEGYGYDLTKADRLPGSLSEALDALEADTEITDLLGKTFVDAFVAYKRNEIERFGQFVTDWEFREYAYHL